MPKLANGQKSGSYVISLLLTAIRRSRRVVGIQAGFAKKSPQPTPEALLAGIANAG